MNTMPGGTFTAEGVLSRIGLGHWAMRAAAVLRGMGRMPEKRRV